jgi:hypothetical protein
MGWSVLGFGLTRTDDYTLDKRVGIFTKIHGLADLSNRKPTNKSSNSSYWIETTIGNILILAE